MEPPLGASQRLRFKFVLRFGASNRKRQQNKCTQNTVGPNEFTDLEKFGVEHHRRPKTIFVMTLAERPGTGITLTASSHGSAAYHQGKVHPTRP